MDYENSASEDVTMRTVPVRMWTMMAMDYGSDNAAGEAQGEDPEQHQQG